MVLTAIFTRIVRLIGKIFFFLIGLNGNAVVGHSRLKVNVKAKENGLSFDDANTAAGILHPTFGVAFWTGHHLVLGEIFNLGFFFVIPN